MVSLLYVICLCHRPIFYAQVRLRNLEGDLRTIFDVSQPQETLEGAVCIAHTCNLYQRCHVNRLVDNRVRCFHYCFGDIM